MSDCTEPDRANCPRMCVEFCNAAATTTPHAQLVERLHDEAALCRNDGANDIAALLDEAAAALAKP